MIYNWDYDYNELEKKRKICFDWGVQIADCRFRPLNSTFDNYNPRKVSQSNEDYYINEKWTDEEVRKFRSNVRKHNICVRYKISWDKYERRLETINSKKTKR